MAQNIKCQRLKILDEEVGKHWLDCQGLKYLDPMEFALYLQGYDSERICCAPFLQPDGIYLNSFVEKRAPSKTKMVLEAVLIFSKHQLKKSS